MANEKTIALSGQFVREDRRVAAAAISPGELVAIDSSGDIIPHGTAGGTVQVAFATENELAGDGIEVDIAAGDQVPVAYFHRGALVRAFLDNTSGDATVGDPMESTGDGNLRVVVPQAVDEAGTATFDVITGNIVGFAEEDVTSPGTGRVRINIRAA